MRRSREPRREEELLESRSRDLDLSDSEQKEIKERGRAKAVVIHEVIRLEGEQELRRPMWALAWSGLAAGLSMGFSLVAEGLIHASLPDQPWRSLISNLGYTVGFLIVVLGRQQLFTENTLTVILPLLNQRNGKTLMRVLRLWTIVLVTNLIGALIFAWVISNTEIFTFEVRQAFTEISLQAIEAKSWVILERGIFAGWLIALMVWLLPSAESSQIAIIIILTYLVGIGGLAHIIAGSVEVLYIVTTKAITWGEYFGRFMIPALLGNIIGGVSLVAALNYGQVAPQINRK
ncbi:MAG: formate/nitrite transporter family protein [Nostoc sp.]|uniref:formate/nitrite transporter family protein n=1 Tax=Nostoc sp. TaxID=1180 RepID=UPI002FF5E684